MAQQVGQPGTQPIVLQATGNTRFDSSCGRIIETLLAKSILGLGVVQLLIGSLCIIFNIASIAMHLEISYVGHGIWCGVLFVLAGAFGITSGRTKRSGVVVTCMVLSILSAVFSVVLISTASIGWVVEPYNYNYYRRSEPCCYYYDSSHRDESCCVDYEDRYGHKLSARIAMHAMLVVLGVLEGIIAIVTASFCCHGICCCSRPGAVLSPGVHYVPNVQGAQVVVMQGAPGVQQTIPLNPGYLNNPQQYGQPIQAGVFQGAGQTQPTGAVGPPPYTWQQKAPGFDNI